MRTSFFQSGLGAAGRAMDRVEASLRLPGVRGRLLRPRGNRILAGVCAGFAEYFGWDLMLLRALVVVLSVASSGLLVLGYAIAWVLIPEGLRALPGNTASR